MAKQGEDLLDKKIKPRKMQAGEFETYKAFEETAVHNIKLCVAYSNETRALIRSFEDKIQNLQNIILSYDGRLQAQQKQIAQLLQNKYNEGT